MEQRVNLMEVMRTLMVSRKFIALCTAGALLVSVVVALVLPQWYRAKATVLPPDSAASQMDLAGMMMYAGYQPALIPTLSSPSEIYEAILKSARVRDAVVDSFDLVEVYDADDREEAREKLGKHCDVSVTPAGVVVVECEDKNAQRAADMSNAFMFELDQFNRYSKVTSAKAVREFIENRIDETLRELDEAEAALRQFKAETGVVLISEQTRVSIETAALLYGQITELEVRKETLSRFATEKSPEIIDLNRQIAALERKLSEMGYGDATPDTKSSRLFPSASDAPEMEMQLAGFMREVEIKRAVYGVLSQQYEEARIQEMRDTPTVQVLDRAQKPLKRWRPKRKAIVIVSVVSAFLLSCIVVLVRERMKKNPDSRDVEMISEIGSTLSGDLHAVSDFLKRGAAPRKK
jgi:uncharacterized protein involved in exopolysaccharide biosynthesis